MRIHISGTSLLENSLNNWKYTSYIYNVFRRIRVKMQHSKAQSGDQGACGVSKRSRGGWKRLEGLL